jgi:hypothetical protein
MFTTGWRASLVVFTLVTVCGTATVGISQQAADAEQHEPADVMANRLRKSLDKMKQISRAMLIYSDSHNHTLPPAFTSRDGKPLLSWRVAILPYLDQEALYKEFRLDEPWDSEHNKKLLFKMPEVFRSPASKNIGPLTAYLTPRGATTAFPGEKAVMLTQIPDGTSNTIGLVEVDDDRSVLWTAPKDWTFDVHHPKAGLGHLHREGFCVAMCDGTSHFLPTDYPESRLKSIVTRAGRVLGNIVRP